MCYIEYLTFFQQQLIDDGFEHVISVEADQNWEWLLAPVDERPDNWEFNPDDVNELPLNLRTVDSDDEMEAWIPEDDSDEEIVWTDSEFDASTIDGEEDGDDVHMVMDSESEEDQMQDIIDYAQAWHCNEVRVMSSGEIVTYLIEFDNEGNVVRISISNIE